MHSVCVYNTDSIDVAGDAAPNQSRKIRDSWDSIHVLEVTESSKSANYKLTSTVMLYMLTEKPDTGDVSLSGSLTRQVCTIIVF